MRRKLLASALLISFSIAGCATGRSGGLSRNQRDESEATRLATAGDAAADDIAQEFASATAKTPAAETELTAYEEDVPPAPHGHSAPILPHRLVNDPVMNDKVMADGMFANVDGALSLGSLENMALANNPTLVQASAQITAANGAAFQAGRYLNPVIGYTGEQIGVNGTAGETQGGFVAQEFVAGGKLRLSRAKWMERVQIAETNAIAQQHRVLNDVRVQFYRALAAQRLVEIHHELFANGQDNLQTHREMLNLGQTNQPGLLRAEVDLQRDRLDLQQAENEFQHAWRNLISLVGVPDLVTGTLVGKLELADESLDWETALSRLLSSSPELTAAYQKIRHDEIAVQRERVEPIPNLLTSVTVGRNYESLDTTTSVNLGIALPIFDRNRGTIQQAQSDLARSHAEVRRLELELRTRLASHYRDYQTASQRVQAYRSEMLPKAKQAFDLLHAGYKARRVAWPDVLMAQRLYLNLRREHVANLTSYRENDVAIRGMLLTGGLTEPAGPAGGGHIDAVPKPR